MAEMSVQDAVELMKATADGLPGAFCAEIALYYHAGVTGPEAWACEVEGDLLGDTFRVWGSTPQEAIQRAVDESWRRVPPE